MPVEKKQHPDHKREELKIAIGNRVFLKRPMPSQELLDGFADLPAANIADTMGRSCAMNPRIRLMSGFQGIMVGPALTVKARTGA